MSEIERLVFEEDGETYEIFVQSKTPRLEIPQSSASSSKVNSSDDDDFENYGVVEEAKAKLEDIHKIIRGYTKYAIGAFKNLAGTEVEEITLKFGMNIGGKTGIPVLTEGSAEANFEIEVKCKFPNNSPSP
ncbi:MAG: hypothetical protein J7647_14925 [Cyanobacteria bacterium SBLK]|nr:hypothetical protein [Cyanobacteria bacterium SBLK]